MSGPKERRPDTTTRYDLSGPDGDFTVDVVREADGFRITLRGKEYFLKLRPGSSEASLVAEVSDKPAKVTIRSADGQSVEIVVDGKVLSFRRQSGQAIAPQVSVSEALPPKGVVVAPMPGKVIGLMSKAGDEVQPGDPLVVIESMKMETAIRSDRKGTVEEILVSEGSIVKRGQILVKFRD